MNICDCEIKVSIKGSGQVMVLLHGWGQNHKMMSFIQEAYCDHYCVVNLDLAGFGESEEPSNSWTIEQYADMLQELLITLKLEDPILVAHSFGARIALYYAYKYKTKSLILTGAAGIISPKTISQKIQILTYKLLKKLNIPCAMGSDDYQNSSMIMKQVLVKCVNEDLRYICDDIDALCLLICGEKDDVTPLWMHEEFEKHLKNAYVVTMPGDHFAYYQYPQHFLSIMDAFLKGDNI